MGCPAVVKDDVVVAQVSKAPVDNLFGAAEEQILAHVTRVGVPIVLRSARSVRVIEPGAWKYSTHPAHLRSDGETIVTQVSGVGSSHQPCQRES